MTDVEVAQVGNAVWGGICMASEVFGQAVYEGVLRALRENAKSDPPELDYRRLLKRYVWHAIEQMENEHGKRVSFAELAFGKQGWQSSQEIPPEEQEELDHLFREILVERYGTEGGQTP